MGKTAQTAKDTAQQTQKPDGPLYDQSGGDRPWGGGGGTNINPPGYPYWGSSGGYGGKSAEEQQEEKQAVIGNLVTMTGKRLADMAANSMASMKPILSSYDENKNSFLRNSQLASILTEWQPNQQREQSTYRAIRNRMSNGAYGSDLANLNEGMARIDDMNDVELINTSKENSSQIYDSFRNAAIQLANDAAEQANAINEEYSKAQASFWSTLNNIDPLLAEEAMKDKNKGKSVTVGSGTDKYTLPEISFEQPDDLKALMVKLDIPNAFDPRTGQYIRPDRAVNAANKIGNTGKANKASIAHREFGNEMDAYKRRV